MMETDALDGDAGVAREIAVVGAAGFVGQHLLAQLRARPGVRVRVLVHRTAPAYAGEQIIGIPGDLLDAESVLTLMAPKTTVINLAYLAGGNAERNLRALTNLCEACAAVGAARLVHCSTAVVVGRTASRRVDEQTHCKPRTAYERSKLELEQLAFRLGRGRFEVTVLRPTAIVGAGGQNLAKFVRSLRAGRRCLNYARSSVFANRTLNLVHVDNVAAALVFLALTSASVDGEVFLVSDDDSSDGRFRTVERHLMAGLGIPDYAVPPLRVPSWVLSVLLRAAGRSNVDPHRTYEDGKLCRLGFRKPARLSDGVREFAVSELAPKSSSLPTSFRSGSGARK